MNSDKKAIPNRKGHTYPNYKTLSPMIRKAMQRRQGKTNIDFDLADAIAWEVSQNISSDIRIERAKTLTVDEILNHQSVKNDDRNRINAVIAVLALVMIIAAVLWL